MKNYYVKSDDPNPTIREWFKKLPPGTLERTNLEIDYEVAHVKVPNMTQALCFGVNCQNSDDLNKLDELINQFSKLT